MTPTAPPTEREPLTRAVELLAAGEWQRAHEIVQALSSTMAAWLHGIVHTLEGDLANARYWYGQVGRVFPGAQAVQAEIGSARLAIRGDGESREI